MKAAAGGKVERESGHRRGCMVEYQQIGQDMMYVGKRR
jgi:hypothetical protein